MHNPTEEIRLRFNFKIKKAPMTGEPIMGADSLITMYF
eukprot:COSAG05_NODE_25286_length_198_cov_21.686869_1_plen_37_part_10